MSIEYQLRQRVPNILFNGLYFSETYDYKYLRFPNLKLGIEVIQNTYKPFSLKDVERHFKPFPYKEIELYFRELEEDDDLIYFMLNGFTDEPYTTSNNILYTYDNTAKIKNHLIENFNYHIEVMDYPDHPDDPLYYIFKHERLL